MYVRMYACRLLTKHPQACPLPNKIMSKYNLPACQNLSDCSHDLCMHVCLCTCIYVCMYACGLLKRHPQHGPQAWPSKQDQVKILSFWCICQNSELDSAVMAGSLNRSNTTSSMSVSHAVTCHKGRNMAMLHEGDEGLMRSTNTRSLYQ